MLTLISTRDRRIK